MSIRYRLDEGTHPFSDAVGVVQSVAGPAGAERVTILGRRGQATSVAVGDVVASKLMA